MSNSSIPRSIAVPTAWQSLISYPNARDPPQSSIPLRNQEDKSEGKLQDNLRQVVVVGVAGVEEGLALLGEVLHSRMADTMEHTAEDMLVHMAFVAEVEVSL